MKERISLKKLIIFLCAFAVFGVQKAHAQQAVLSASSTACATTSSCLTVQLGTVARYATFAVSTDAGGNTLTFEATADNGVTWVALNATPSNSATPASTTAAIGVWQANVAAYNAIRIRLSTFVSGTCGVSINVSSTAG